MRIAYKISLGIGGALLLGVAALWLSYSFALRTLCGEESLERKDNGQYVAELFERNCGATTRYMYHVNVYKKGEKLKAGLFSSGTIDSGEVFGSELQQVDFTWIGPKHLKIETDDNSAIHNHDKYPPAPEGIQVDIVSRHPSSLNRK